MTYLHDSVKTSRSFYTDTKIRNMLKNLNTFDWAVEEKERTVAAANEYLKYGLDNLLVYVTQQNIARSYGVNQSKGCPVCGKQIDKYGNYPYTADPLNKPFKLVCPNCMSIFPSNDFDSYYKSGLDENGRFHHDKADKSYLLNELYPDRPSDWCVDDGFGWVDPDGIKTKSFGKVYDREKGLVRKETTIGDNRYTFIAYFNHWYIWLHNFKSHGQKGFVTSAVSTFRDAYLFTGEKIYADAGLVLLSRVSDFYPEYDACVYKWEDGYKHSGGAWGKIVGSIWERQVIDNLMTAYDAFFPAIDGKSLETIRSCEFYKNNPITPKTEKDIILNIENNLLRQILPEVMNHRIRGNVGMHQGSIALAALILQNESFFNECIDFILSTTDKHLWGPGNILRIITDEVDHDGCGNETSVNYNSIWLNGIHSIAEILKGTNRDLYNNPKFMKMFHLDIPYIIADNYSLNIGDTNKAGNPITAIHEKPLLSFFELTGDIKSAQLLYKSAKLRETYKKDSESGSIDIYTDIETIEEKIQNVIDKYGEFKSESKNYSGLGLAKVELINDGDKKSIWMYYGRNTGHGHKDTLMLGIFAYDVYMNPDQGYPVYADGNPQTKNWNKNTISHDTVTVDNQPGKDHIVGIPKHYHAGEYTSVIDVEAPLLYNQTSCYRRTSVVVNMDNFFYTVDFFRIQGGNDHKYVFHGAEGETTTENLTLSRQVKGTFAGEEIEYASVEYDESNKDGFNYLYDVHKDKSVKRPFSVDWKVKDTWGVWDMERDIHLKISMIDPVNEVVLAKGKPPQNKPGNPKEYTYMIAMNKGTDIKSLFSAVIEAYENNSNILRTESMFIKTIDGSDASFGAKAVKVTLKNGRVDYIINSTDNKTYIINDEIEFKGFTAVISFMNNRIVYMYVNDVDLLMINGDRIVSDNPVVSGSVVNFTKEPGLNNSIIVKLDKDICPSLLTGAYVSIETDLIRNGFYEIVSAEYIEQNIYALNTGDVSFIRGFIDATDFDKGYKYNISEGESLKIVLPVETKW